MIRLIQRRLIIPRGDTGSFSIPVLKQPNAGDIAVFTIFDCSTRTRMFQKQVAVEGDTISIAFTHTDTVNLKPGKYFWDIKFYANPVFVEDELVDGVEVDSYYAAYSLPDCEIRETADNYLVAPDGPDSYLTPEQLDIVTEAIAALQDAITKTETNVTHYPQIRDGVWYVWDAEVGDFVSTDSHTPTKVSELENDSGYLTTESDPTVPAWAKQATKPSYTASEVGALPADTYIPQKTSDLTNDSDFAVDANYIHTDNNYTTEEKTKLNSIAEGAEVNVNADWDAVEGDAAILHKPTNVSAFENDAGYLTEHQDISGKADKSEIPTKVSQLQNDSGYLTVETDPTVPAWAKEPTKPAYTAAEVGAPTVAQMEEAIANVNTMKIHICGQDEYDSETGMPTVANPDSQSFYLVPGGADSNLFIEWVYVNGAWERFGSADIDLSGYATKADTVLDTTLSKGRKAGTTIGEGSFAFGEDVEASGAGSYAFGTKSTSSGVFSHAEGELTIASGNGSHAEGENTTANGQFMHAQGISNVSDTLYPSWVSGHTYFLGDRIIYNNKSYECLQENSDLTWNVSKWKRILVNGNMAFVIGNGITLNPKSNAAMIDWDGNGHFMGDVYVHANADSTGGTKVATVEDIPEVPVTDVQVAGSSVIENGIAKIVKASASSYGVVKVDSTYGIGKMGNGSLTVIIASQDEIKTGSSMYSSLAPISQHASTFYGLSKVAGVDLANETVTLGTYPETSKTAIKTMLGVQDGLKVVRLI